MTAHCRHCLGNCDGTCLLPGGAGLCIHSQAPRRALRDWPLLVRTRTFWRRVFWGVR